VDVMLAGGRLLRIRAPDMGQGQGSVTQVRLRGQAVNPQALPHLALVGGGDLHFQLSPLTR
jgi:putative alpha-1,2-mannosidase